MSCGDGVYQLYGVAFTIANLGIEAHQSPVALLGMPVFHHNIASYPYHSSLGKGLVPVPLGKFC